MASTGWELVAVLPAQEAFAPLHQLELLVLYLLLAAVGGGAVLMWLVVRHMLAPLTRLQWCATAPMTRPPMRACRSRAATRSTTSDAPSAC